MHFCIRFLIMMFVLVNVGATAYAGNYVVTVFTDTNAGTPPGSGAGNPGDLRDAIITANTAGGTNTITFSGGPATITLSGPLPPITSDLTIDGGTAGNIAIDGSNLYRAFFVDSGTVVLKYLKIQNAKAKGGDGGTGDGGGGGGAGLGAGVFVNNGTANVTISHVDFVNVRAVGGNGGNFVGNSPPGGGGGGLGGDGGSSTGNYGAPGGGGVLGAGTNTTSGANGANGGLGGGGGGGLLGTGTAGTGGAAYAGNTAGGSPASTAGGAGGFGGGGGGAPLGVGGAGGFGGGGGGTGTGTLGGAGGPGGGAGGSGGANASTSGGSLGSGISGGGSGYGNGPSGGGGGAAAGPVIFINLGSVTLDSATVTSSGHTATGGTGGTSSGTAVRGYDGTASSAPIFNYGGTYNTLTTTGPIYLGPVVTAIAPTSGLTAGGTSVVITGGGFTGATGVSFGSTVATTFTVGSDTQITATAPASSVGTVDITVTTSAGISSVVVADQFTYQKAAQTIGTISFTPASLVTGGTTTVSATATSGLAVAFSSTTPTICTVSGTTITGVTAGSCTIAADQAGNAGYNAAAQVTQVLSVANAVAPNLAVSALSNNAVTVEPTQNISGLISNANSSTSVTVNGVNTPVNTDGRFSYPVQLLLGSNTVTISATNSSGIVVSETRTLVLDSSVPHLEITAPADNSIVSQNSVTLTGSIMNMSTGQAVADPAMVVQFSVNNAALQTAGLTDAAFSFTANLVPGMNTIRVLGTNGDGKTVEAKRTIVYEPAFSIAITSPATDVHFALDSFLLQGRVVDNTTPVSVSVVMDGQTFTPAVVDGLFQQNLTFAEDKVFQVVITGTDQNNNSLSVQRNFIHRLPKAGSDASEVVTIVDALQALKMTAGIVVPEAGQILRLDVSPMVNGISVGDGKVDIEDVIVILRMAVGLIQ